MTEAAPQGTGKMVAVMNAEREVIEKACQEASAFGIVAPANYNTPQQIVIGGEVAAVDQAMTLLKEAGEANDSVKCEWPFSIRRCYNQHQKIGSGFSKIELSNDANSCH